MVFRYQINLKGLDMPNPIRISEAASLALHTMTLLAGNTEVSMTTRQIADELNASEAHLAKVMQRLVHAGFVKSVRGPKGGFRLARAPSDVSLIEVYELIEGPISTGCCYFGEPICRNEVCIFGGLLESIGTQVREHLANTRLSDLIGGKAKLCVTSEKS
jgi:Rrf2 family protein